MNLRVCRRLEGDCLSLTLTWDTLRNQRELHGNGVARSGRSPVLGRGVGQGREYTDDGSGALESQKQVLVEGVLVSIGLKTSPSPLPPCTYKTS